MQMTSQEYENALHLAHFGTKGMRWGIRRYQNYDGTYTDLGAERRREESGFKEISPNDKSFQREIRSLDWKNLDDYDSNSSNRGSGEKSRGLSDRAKKALKIGAIAAGSALTIYGGYKIHQKLKDKKLGSDGLPFDIRKDLPFAKASKLKEGLKSFGEGTKKVVTEGAKEAGKASVAAAIAAVGTIAIRKLTNKFSDNESDSQNARDLNYIAREASVAAVKSGTNASANRVRSGFGNPNNITSNGTSNGGGFSREKLDKIIANVGKPHQVHSWGDADVDKRYQDVMKLYDGNKAVKEEIRAMRKGAFDIDQIEKEYGKK